MITGNEAETNQEIHKYYKQLYSKEETELELQEEFLTKIEKKLPNKIAEDLDKEISEKEIINTIDSSNENKSPGLDGITFEFYQTFSALLCKDLTIIANEIYKGNTEYSNTQKKAIIKLMYKKGEREIIQNWRPISLLCTDYKIITKTIANRLTPTLHHIIDQDQTCNIPGRNIYSNLQLIRNLIDHVNVKKEKAYIISFDFEKAFDKVDHNYMVKTLEAFNFGDTFINFVKKTYTKINANIMNNGFMTSIVDIEREA